MSALLPNPPDHSRHILGATVVALTAAAIVPVLIGAVAWLVERATAATTSAVEVVSSGWPLMLAALLLWKVAAFKAGQYHRGFFHARGIWRSHKAAIRGGNK
jgi:hypothetical protein